MRWTVACPTTRMIVWPGSAGWPSWIVFSNVNPSGCYILRSQCDEDDGGQTWWLDSQRNLMRHTGNQLSFIRFWIEKLLRYLQKDRKGYIEELFCWGCFRPPRKQCHINQKEFRVMIAIIKFPCLKSIHFSKLHHWCSWLPLALQIQGIFQRHVNFKDKRSCPQNMVGGPVAEMILKILAALRLDVKATPFFSPRTVVFCRIHMNQGFC